MQAHLTDRMRVAHDIFGRHDARTLLAHRVRSSRKLVWEEALALFTVLAVVTIVLSAATAVVTIIFHLMCRLVAL